MLQIKMICDASGESIAVQINMHTQTYQMLYAQNLTWHTIHVYH